MDIELYITGSEPNCLQKQLQNNITLSGNLRGESSVINPSFVVELQNPTQYNYCFIPEFNRYYYITNIVSMRTNIWRIDCSVDVLMSYQAQILDLNVVIENDTTIDQETYMVGDIWQRLVKTKTDIINFPNGLLEQGEYILITSGGIAGVS